VLGAADLPLLRPEEGISPAVDIYGRVLVRDVVGGAPVTEADLAGPGAP
jgi:N,N'-diacetyllegionaminate synthase